MMQGLKVMWEVPEKHIINFLPKFLETGIYLLVSDGPLFDKCMILVLMRLLGKGLGTADCM